MSPVHHVADDVFGPAAGIGVEGQVAAAEDAAGDVRPNGSVVLIEDDNRAAGNRPADSLRCFAQVGRRRESANADLRGAVAVVDDVAVCVGEPLRQAGIQPGSARYHHAQRRPRVSCPHIVGQIEDAREHDRHGGERVGATLRRLGERCFGVELTQGQCGSA
jgi:hypothetical protein